MGQMLPQSVPGSVLQALWGPLTSSHMRPFHRGWDGGLALWSLVLGNVALLTCLVSSEVTVLGALYLDFLGIPSTDWRDPSLSSLPKRVACGV